MEATDPEPRRLGESDLPMMQEILSASLDSGDRYSIHPGDLAWWMYHDDPGHPGHLEYWTDSGGLLVVDTHGLEIDAFAKPGHPVASLIEFGQQRLGGKAEVGWIADADSESVEYLTARGYERLSVDRSYRWDLDRVPVPPPEPPPGWRLRALRGEEEAKTRREASHAAFESTMDETLHLQRYLGLMRSPVYDSERDLVAVDEAGRVGAFMIWWPDASGIAQIEPFGTHPEFQRLGLGRALINFGLRRMKAAGMVTARVCTNDYRPATVFYESVGFLDVGGLGWWKPTRPL